jgi:hypothetical protein
VVLEFVVAAAALSAVCVAAAVVGCPSLAAPGVGVEGALAPLVLPKVGVVRAMGFDLGIAEGEVSADATTSGLVRSMERPCDEEEPAGAELTSDRSLEWPGRGADRRATK